MISYARKLREDFEYLPFESPLAIELRCQGEVQRILSQQLDGCEREDEVRNRVHALMEAAEGCA